MPRGKRKMGRRGLSAGGDKHALAGLNAWHARLTAERADLDRKIGLIENTLRELGGGRAGPMNDGPRRGRRGPRRGSLKEYILKVLSAKSGPMAVKDVAAAVVGAGYKSKNKTLAKSTGIALAQLRNVAKIGRGLFKLK